MKMMRTTTAAHTAMRTGRRLIFIAAIIAGSAAPPSVEDQGACQREQAPTEQRSSAGVRELSRGCRGAEDLVRRGGCRGCRRRFGTRGRCGGGRGLDDDVAFHVGD